MHDDPAESMMAAIQSLPKSPQTNSWRKPGAQCGRVVVDCPACIHPNINATPPEATRTPVLAATSNAPRGLAPARAVLRAKAGLAVRQRIQRPEKRDFGGCGVGKVAWPPAKTTKGLAADPLHQPENLALLTKTGPPRTRALRSQKSFSPPPITFCTGQRYFCPHVLSGIPSSLPCWSLASTCQLQHNPKFDPSPAAPVLTLACQ